MVPFLILLLVVLVLGVLLCEWKRDAASVRSRDLIFLCAAGAALTLFAALRGKSVGIDYQMYEEYFLSRREGRGSCSLPRTSTGLSGGTACSTILSPLSRGTCAFSWLWPLF